MTYSHGGKSRLVDSAVAATAVAVFLVTGTKVSKNKINLLSLAAPSPSYSIHGGRHRSFGLVADPPDL
jgi:hypothetical protein